VAPAGNCSNATLDLVHWEPATGVLYVCIYNQSFNLTTNRSAADYVSARNYSRRLEAAAGYLAHQIERVVLGNSSSLERLEGSLRFWAAHLLPLHRTSFGWGGGEVFVPHHELTNITNYTRVLEAYLLEFLVREEYEEACRQERQEESGFYNGSGLNAGRFSRPLFVQLDGRGFASFDTSVALRVRYTPAEISRWSSDTSLAMRVARGGDQQLPVIVTVTQQVPIATHALTGGAGGGGGGEGRGACKRRLHLLLKPLQTVADCLRPGRWRRRRKP